ncbi:MAG: class I SAM-dependent methyltransferase [Pseudomonadota bacterium]
MKLYYDASSASIAERYGSFFELEPLSAEADAEPALLAQDHRLQLRLPGSDRGTCVDPRAVARRVSRRSDLARACGFSKLKRPRILDACAGWGIDGLSLAQAGASVTLLERERPIWALLDDLCRQQPWGHDALHCVPAEAWMTATPERWDVVYLDPMFPPRSKTALPKERLQLLSTLTGPPQSLELLLEGARRCASRRVVLKRRRKDPIVGDPSGQIAGKTVRYDLYAAA